MMYDFSLGMFSSVAGNGSFSGRFGMCVHGEGVLRVSAEIALADGCMGFAWSIGYGNDAGRMFTSVQPFRLKYTWSIFSHIYKG